MPVSNAAKLRRFDSKFWATPASSPPGYAGPYEANLSRQYISRWIYFNNNSESFLNVRKNVLQFIYGGSPKCLPPVACLRNACILKQGIDMVHISVTL